MKVTYDISVSELKALLEIIEVLMKRAGLDETLARSLYKKLNEKHIR